MIICRKKPNLVLNIKEIFYSDFRRHLGIHNNDKLYELHVVQTVFEKQKQSMWKTSCTSKGNHSYLKVVFHLIGETTVCKIRNISIIERSAHIECVL